MKVNEHPSHAHSHQRLALSTSITNVDRLLFRTICGDSHAYCSNPTEEERYAAHTIEVSKQYENVSTIAATPQKVHNFGHAHSHSVVRLIAGQYRGILTICPSGHNYCQAEIGGAEINKFLNSYNTSTSRDVKVHDKSHRHDTRWSDATISWWNGILYELGDIQPCPAGHTFCQMYNVYPAGIDDYASNSVEVGGLSSTEVG